MVHLGWDAFWKVIAMSDTPCKGPGKPWTALWFWYIFGFGWIIPSCLLPSRLPPSCGNLLLTAAKRVNSLACSACPVTTTLLTNCLWSPKQSLRTWRTCACCLLCHWRTWKQLRCLRLVLPACPATSRATCSRSWACGFAYAWWQYARLPGWSRRLSEAKRCFGLIDCEIYSLPQMVAERCLL